MPVPSGPGGAAQASSGGGPSAARWTEAAATCMTTLVVGRAAPWAGQGAGRRGSVIWNSHVCFGLYMWLWKQLAAAATEHIECVSNRRGKNCADRPHSREPALSPRTHSQVRVRPLSP